MGFCVPAPVIAQNLPGLQYFRLLGPLFDHLHAVGTTRDRAGNRQLFYDQYATLLLLYFFNPTVTSLRGLQQMTTFAHVQAQFGIRRTSLGALSEAASVFDAALLQAVLTALSAQLQPHLSGAEQAALVSLMAVDGSLLPGLAADALGRVARRPASGCKNARRLCGPAPWAGRRHGHSGQRLGACRVTAFGAARRVLRL